ncbi:ATP-binding cassette domain-containing protein [Sutcliffiella rhizosphaerae]|uniref:Aliphatic sulfonates import ATP-binding protein SsuB n=1 Tax=Sutcliffiella rhizosphaerae TaxID=2880967 RepID=A0ABM8YMR4_9BACI|nr:ATP-binding cassette domain-containing protein [Sutcliffiella rhizosphaerae]CAG9621209.1 Aliphatic sulfonates import ATP-binding protein SsuB [Sutcliffiella rhizosphaerae]
MSGVEITIEKLDKSFGTLQVLENIDLHVGAGEFLAIVGKSGCGKSTLLRTIAGLESVSGGDISFNSIPVKGVQDTTRMMFQDARLLPWKDVLTNVRVGNSDRAKAEAALSNVGLLDKSDEWPGVLSGGQKQRVSLARALAGDPKLILFDEPLGALDALTRIEMQQLIEELWKQQGFTSILVTHDVGEAIILADRVILIEDGGIALDVRVDLPRPRARDSKFTEYETMILDRILEKKGGESA